MEVELCQSMLQNLERMERRLDAVHVDLREIAGRMDHVLEQMVVADRRLMRLDARLERIEHRLGHNGAVN